MAVIFHTLSKERIRVSWLDLSCVSFPVGVNVKWEINAWKMKLPNSGI